MRRRSYENVLHLHFHFHTKQTHFHMKRFARGLVLEERQTATLKWSIERLSIERALMTYPFGNLLNLST